MLVDRAADGWGIASVEGDRLLMDRLDSSSGFKLKLDGPANAGAAAGAGFDLALKNPFSVAWPSLGPADFVFASSFVQPSPPCNDDSSSPDWLSDTSPIWSDSADRARSGELGGVIRARLAGGGDDGGVSSLKE